MSQLGGPQGPLLPSTRRSLPRLWQAILHIEMTVELGCFSSPVNHEMNYYILQFCPWRSVISEGASKWLANFWSTGFGGLQVESWWCWKGCLRSNNGVLPYSIRGRVLKPSHKNPRENWRLLDGSLDVCKFWAKPRRWCLRVKRFPLVVTWRTQPLNYSNTWSRIVRWVLWAVCRVWVWRLPLMELEGIGGWSVCYMEERCIFFLDVLKSPTALS